MQGITSDDLAAFLDERVNLKREDVKAYRDQVQHLRERLELYVNDHPDFALIKMLHFGSLAKATAISPLRELDLAVYLRPERLRSHELHAVLSTARDLLIQVYPQMEPSQFVIDPPAVTIHFRTSGLNVDVVPVIPNGKPDDRGQLALTYPQWVETSIPLHLQFIRDRAQRHSLYRALVRLTKWWRQERDVPLQSFLIELLWARLVDGDSVPDDLQEALLAFFAYIERTRLEERIVFPDNYCPAEAEPTGDLVQVMDPVTPTNNVAARITCADRDAVLQAAEAALDDVAAGSSAYSKGRGVASYQRVFGTAFTA
ncbi:MAG TPA: CBASS oligonucleotide cyclase [Gemmatimonadaceae bacterium]|nr:CBASS oligonucleotide cyclase [Gemmatimonadaceae bacterium]